MRNLPLEENMSLHVLKYGSMGEEVSKWQSFLIGTGYLKDLSDGIFGSATELATKKYQEDKGLRADGIVGPNTYSQATKEPLAIIEDQDEFPPKPDFPPLVGTSARQKVFGKFDFVHAPTRKNKEQIKILGDWENDNIVSIFIPVLKGVDTYGRPNSGKMTFHKKAAEQLKGLWSAWSTQNYKTLILTYGGSYVPRFVRGSASTLSNHAFGSAFDINMEWNGLGKTPAIRGSKGSVRELVPIANDFGFYWGGILTVESTACILKLPRF